MNIDNGFGLLIAFVFAIGPQLGRLGPKTKELVVYFCLGEGENLPKFHLRALQARGQNIPLQDETGQINNLKGK